jgi:hypothetical protein
MTRPLNVVMLAGTLRPSPLRAQLGIPLPCLPLGRRGTVLGTWLATFESLGEVTETAIVLNSEAEAEAVRASAEDGGKPVRAIAEAAAWRGAGGLLRDASADAPPDALVVVVETSTMPPASLAAVAAAFDAGIDGVVGVCGADQPAGVYAFTREAIEHIPHVGYFDLKEQFLPRLFEADLVVRAISLGAPMARLRTRRAYLDAVRLSLERDGADPPQLVDARASISPSAILDGCCLVQPDVVVEDGAVVHDSVILAGATIGGGAVVSRSVLGPRATVAARDRAVRTVVTAGAAATAGPDGAVTAREAS